MKVSPEAEKALGELYDSEARKYAVVELQGEELVGALRRLAGAFGAEQA